MRRSDESCPTRPTGHLRERRARLGLTAAMLGGALALAACSSDGGTSTGDAGADAGSDPTALFRRLGGEAGIETAIDGFLARVLADPKINGYFLNSSIDGTRLRTCLIKIVVAATGGPAVYPGPGAPADEDGCRNMADSHRGLGISTNDFADLGGHMVAELQALGVAPSDVDAITRVLQSLAPDVIESPDGDETIYHRLRRKTGITAIVEDFVARVVADEKINGYFLNSSLDAARLGTCLIRQLCAATGGPCKYGEEVPPELFGDRPCQPMGPVHRDLGISARDFDDLAGHLVEALQAGGVSQGDVEAIVGAIAPLATEIVEDPTGDATIYQRIGRKPAVRGVIGAFVSRVVADPKINGYFLDSDLDGARLGTCLTRQVCAATGGPCRYGLEAGVELIGGTPCKDMRTSHLGLGISTADFNDLASALAGALTASSALSAADIDAVLGAVAPLASEIVEDPTNDATIYQRIGRKPAIAAVIDDFVVRVTGDVTIAGFFARANAARLGTCLVRQVCDATGGPCTYGAEAGPELFDGVPCRDMVSSHTNVRNPPVGTPSVGITKADFDALVGHLVDAMNATGAIAPADRDAILGALAPLCSQIVEGATGC